MSIGVCYAFKDLVGVISNPLFGFSFPLMGGNVGLGSVTIVMSTERTTHELSADGTVMPSYVAGDNGSISIEILQTSLLHHALLSLYNLCVTAAEAHDVTGWAATTMSFRTLLDGSHHILTGCSFGKIPDKPYHAAGQKITWSLLCADIVNTGSTAQAVIGTVISGLGL